MGDAPRPTTHSFDDPREISLHHGWLLKRTHPYLPIHVQEVPVGRQLVMDRQPSTQHYLQQRSPFLAELGVIRALVLEEKQLISCSFTLRSPPVMVGAAPDPGSSWITQELDALVDVSTLP